MPPMSVGLLNRPQLLTFLWWQPNKPNARCWRSWNNQTCRCIHRRSKPLLQWKPNENVSEAAGHQDSPVETVLVQIIMCHHVQTPTLKAILCIPYCSAEQCMKVSDWSVAHADCTLQPHTAPAVRLPPCADSISLLYPNPQSVHHRSKVFRSAFVCS